jgi:DNA polymerase-1
MVAQTIELPNIRKMFVPDPGYEIVDCDLAGADAQVVAWEADDADLKAAFRAGVSVHIKNARECFPDKTRGMSDEAIKKQSQPGGVYYDNKRAVHATNYGGTSKGIAGILGWTVHETDTFQSRWFGLHPGIRNWHRRTANQLAQFRQVSNKYGFRRIYFDRIEGLLPEALAWVPQSTVAVTCNKGALAVEAQCPRIQLLIQVHDSLVMQYPIKHRVECRAELKAALHITVPYDDPLTIPWSMKASTQSWGDATPIVW